MGVDEAVRAAQAGTTNFPEGLIERLANHIGGYAGAQAVFGQPVERDGVTVIPVAKVRWGFGGGAGTGSKPGSGEEGAGGGGGGGVNAVPVGFIEISNGQARFVPWEDPASRWPLLVAGAVAAWIVLRGLRGLFR